VCGQTDDIRGNPMLVDCNESGKLRTIAGRLAAANGYADP
jgi:hypothetical protein